MSGDLVLNTVQRYSSLVPNLGQLMPPEVARGSWNVIRNNPVHAIDSFDYGLLVAECFNGSFVPAEQAAQASNIPSSMTPAYRRLFHANPKARLSTANFLDQGRRSGGFFQTPLINLTEGIDKLGLMSDGERDEFFRSADSCIIRWALASNSKTASLTMYPVTSQKISQNARYCPS